MSGLLNLGAEFTVREKIPTTVYRFPDEATRKVSAEVAELIRSASPAHKVVLGLSTGSAPSGVYDELIRMHKTEGLSFQHVITFNVDEYYPMKASQIQSAAMFMEENLFSHVDLPKENINMLSGEVPPSQVGKYCQEYEDKIKHAGGIDLMLLPIGKAGQLAYNEPGTAKDSRSRVVDIDRVTRIDLAAEFFGMEYVPHESITVGLATILSQSKKIIIMAFSEGRARIISRLVEGDVTIQLPATFVQGHPNTRVIIDAAAAEELARFKHPWTIKSNSPMTIPWNPILARKAVIWLSLKLKKPILKLVEEDYDDNSLTSLLGAFGPAPVLNLRVFRHMQNTITGWPGGRPLHGSTPPSPSIGSWAASNPQTMPESFDNLPADLLAVKWEPARDTPMPPAKRVIVFSPHPDDDVISMGGTLIRLADQGHTVHVAYQTSGNIAVWDDDAKRFANFATEFAKAFGIEGPALEKFHSVEKSVEDFIAGKKPAEIDSKEVQKIKGLVRRTEARAGARYAGVKPDRIHFLELPFYETGAVKKKPLGEEDIKIMMDFLTSVRPQQIYAAGDLSDPHGTHRVCLKAILAAIIRLKDEPWMKECQIWLYRGAWQEWEPDRIEMAVPMSPHEMMRKRMSIFKHQSQKDTPVFPGADKREFWQRAEERNKATAHIYDSLGLTEFEGTEAFIRWHIDDRYGTNPI
eukprot:TRINITY_DN1680_c0_g1_i3.p1 TRINITY_DN1680_c0_g1~~TRINITY_DN1680_c0_g1_i3.p1  ORF type:complete len:692 (-),score=220.68 TRINITY_DN1680_c0_g1_i3:95-2170(-)